MFGKTRIERTLAGPARTGIGLADALALLSKETVTKQAEADLIVQCLRFFPLPTPAVDRRPILSPLHHILAFFQRVKDDSAAGLFRTRGIPEVLRIYEGVRAQITDVAAHRGDRDDLLFLCKLVTMYAPEGGLPVVVGAARDAITADGYLWSVIFGVASEQNHPWREKLFEELRDPLPRGHALVAFLDFANTVCREEERDDHPFASPAGSWFLRELITRNDPDDVSDARIAAAALPFVGGGLMSELLPVALHHPAHDVRLEAASVAVRGGLANAGLPLLERACEDPRSVRRACAYLEELGLADRIPPIARDEGFLAMAELCDWLAHPSEFGRPPDEIELRDTRVLFWPPTNDERQVWLFRYEYHPDSAGGGSEHGVGMVGSITFALFGEATADLPSEEAYGLHCAWELEINQDPRAARVRSPAAGLSILRRYNKSRL